MPDKKDDLTPDVAEARFAAQIAKHGTPKGGKEEVPDHKVEDTPEPPNWHKAGKAGPPGWRQVGDTWEEEAG
jgi:hypothetical protein